MARTVSTATRQDLLQAVQERYRGSLKDEKLRILDEFVAVTGYHRKHVIRLFNAAPVASGRAGVRVCLSTMRPCARRSSCCGRPPTGSAGNGSSRSCRCSCRRLSVTATSRWT